MNPSQTWLRAAATVAFALIGPVATAGTLYTNDFTAGDTTGWSENRLDSTPGTPAHPSDRFLGRFARNDTATLILNGLPAHTQIFLQFDFYAIRSWDGNNDAFGPDLFLLFADGLPAPLLITNFSNTFLPGFSQSFPNAFDPGAIVENAPQTGALETGTLGYLSQTGSPEDSVYRLSFLFPHTSSSLRLVFVGWDLQDVGDEAWGLDNVIVATGVPEPGSFLMAISGVLALGAIRRWRRC